MNQSSSLSLFMENNELGREEPLHSPPPPPPPPPRTYEDEGHKLHLPHYTPIPSEKNVFLYKKMHMALGDADDPSMENQFHEFLTGDLHHRFPSRRETFFVGPTDVTAQQGAAEEVRQRKQLDLPPEAFGGGHEFRNFPHNSPMIPAARQATEEGGQQGRQLDSPPRYFSDGHKLHPSHNFPVTTHAQQVTHDGDDNDDSDDDGDIGTTVFHDF